MFTKLAKLLSPTLRQKEGFTLIELLIVVAIIAILAAIAIPQFSAYRIRGFNAAANSDVRNVATTEEALFADTQRYGQNPAAGALTTAACDTTEVIITGALNPATAAAGGAFIRNNLGSVGFSVSNTVSLSATLEGVNCAAYVAVAKHQNGDACFGRDSDSTASYRATHVAGQALAAGDTPASTLTFDNFSATSGSCANFARQ